MRSGANKLLLGILSLLLVGGVLGYVLISTASSAMEFYKHVDEVTPDQAHWRGKALELHGYVKPGTVQKRLDRDHQRLEYRFTEVNCGQSLPVYYAGVVPDTFKDGAEVVVKGTLADDGFHATEVMAKCPSKYAAQAAAQTLCTTSNAASGKAN